MSTNKILGELFTHEEADAIAEITWRDRSEFIITAHAGQSCCLLQWMQSPEQKWNILLPIIVWLQSWRVVETLRSIWTG